MAKNWIYRSTKVLTKDSVIFDIDGVLADASSRQHFLRNSKPDWESFFDACHEDPLITETARLLEVIDPKFNVILMTGRPISVQAKTVEWLERFSLRWDLLIMRTDGDYSALRKFKQSETSILLKDGYHVALAFEDDQRNVEMFQQLGVPCVYLHSGYY